MRVADYKRKQDAFAEFKVTLSELYGKAVFGPDNSRQVPIAHGRSRFGLGLA